MLWHQRSQGKRVYLSIGKLSQNLGERHGTELTPAQYSVDTRLVQRCRFMVAKWQCYAAGKAQSAADAAGDKREGNERGKEERKDE